MNWFIREIADNSKNIYTAGSKARRDVEKILGDNGWKTIQIKEFTGREFVSLKEKSIGHVRTAAAWKHIVLSNVRAGDTVFFQLPVFNHTLLLPQVLKVLKQNHICTIALIHDLDSIRLSYEKERALRNRLRIYLEEVRALKRFDWVIVHNDKMRDLIEANLGVEKSRLISLDLFDYLCDGNTLDVHEKAHGTFRCAIAGNLSPDKAGYVYALPEGVNYELYGPNLNASIQGVTYHGCVDAEELPGKLDAEFGLVWDGKSIQECSGVYGNYLKYNNPHKTSLYLAAGIPVIIWENAAMASFIKNNRAGITINSLEELPEKLNNMTESEYCILKNNAMEISQRLRTGDFLLSAVDKCRR